MSGVQKRLLILLLLLAFLVRFIRIESVPASLFYDEVDYGYQAQSLVQTGKDYRGSFSPFYVHSFNDVRAPLPAYLTVITTILFKVPELQVRMPFVIAGVLVVLLAFLLVRRWFGDYWKAFWVAAVFATNPWQIQFSRFSHEVMVMTLVFLLGLWLFYKALDSKKTAWLYLSAVSFSFTVYTYRTMSLFLPLTLGMLFLIYRRELLRFGIKKLILVLVIIASIVAPFLYATTLGAPDTPRINQLVLTSNAEVPIWVQRNREVDSGDFSDSTIGKSAIWYSYIFHSKPLSWLDAFFNNYFHTFSTQFLFTAGDPNRRHSVGGMGELLAIDILGFVAGLLFVYRNIAKSQVKWLLAWFLLSPIPAALTSDGSMHAARLFIFSASLLIIVGIGWWSIFRGLKQLKFKKVSIGLLSVLWVGCFVFYLHRYFVHFPIDSARYFGYGFKEAMLKIVAKDADYDKIYMIGSNDPPMIYYLFWSKMPAKYLHEYGTNFSVNTILDKKLDKYKVVNWDDVIGGGETRPELDNLSHKTLYLLTESELATYIKRPKMPDYLKLLEIILYPDQTPSFYLVTGAK